LHNTFYLLENYNEYEELGEIILNITEECLKTEQ